MNFIIGGAYQGKLDYAKNHFGLTERDIFNCSENEIIDFHARCINNLQKYTFLCVKKSIDVIEEFEKHRFEWENSILICEDIFCGVVPLGADMRAWREMTGRLCLYLSHEAETVTRIFCGLEHTLK